MADNVQVTQGVGTTMATDDVGGVQYPRVKLSHGVDGSAVDASSSNPLPISGTVTANTGLSQPLTDSELRATAVPVSVSGVATAAGQATQTTELQAIKTAVETIDNAISGTEMQVDIVSSALPLGAATSANQATTNASLSSIDGKLPSLSGGRVPVDIGGSGSITITSGTVTVSNEVEIKNDLNSPVPVSGTVTANTGLSQPLTDGQLRATAVPVSVSGVATAANQTTGNASLSSIDTKFPAQVGGKIPVDTGGLTDGQLRASAVPVSASSLPLPSGAATAANQTTANASLSSIDGKDFATETTLQAMATALSALDDTTGTIGAATPTKVQMSGYQDVDGNAAYGKLTENGSLGIGNGMKKFRDGFADLPQGSNPDSGIWDIAWENQGSSSVGRAGNAQGASYMKISLCPITAGSQFTMTTKRSFKFPMRFINMLSLSQRIIGQEFEVSIIGVDGAGAITTLTPVADLTISGTVSITSNVATINFASAHDLKTSDRVILLNNTERRLNVGPVSVTVLTATSITVPCTLANGTYTAGGVVRWADPLAYAKNGAGLLHENATATNATFLTRRNGFNTRLLNSSIITTANSTNVAYADPFNATSMNQVIANQEEFTLIPRAPDSTAAPGTALKWHQGLPDEELEYKIRVRAKNLDNITRPIARITAIAKTGTTTATVTTDVPHGLATTDFVIISGVRDQTNFPNLVAQTQVASIIDANNFTVVIGTASTTSSAGGSVFLVQGSVIAVGIMGQTVQSISRTNNILSLIGSATWSGPLPGETVQLHGCDATSMGLYDGAYKVLRISTTTLELESVGTDFGSINCGGAVMRRTDFRVHAISEIEHTRHIVELSNAQGAGDISKSVPVIVANAPAVSQSGTWNIATVTTVTGVTAANLALPGTIADVASAALTTTTTTATLTPTFGTAYQVNIPVTAVSGTNPTLDVAIEESTDNGTNWFKVYDFPRITATGFYNSPILRLRGTRVRYVQTVTGTTPSFTRSVNRSQISHEASQQVQIIDRTIVPNTLNSTTPALLVEGCQDFNIKVRCTAQTTPATLTLQFSDNNVDWHTTGNTLTTAVGFAHAKVQNEMWKFARLIVSAAGSGITLGEAMIVGNGR